MNNAEKNMEKNKPMTVEEATRAIYDATNNMRWISVSDKLPDERLKVLCYDSFYQTIGVGRRWNNQSLVLDDTDDCDVTHWMPLPPAPTSDPNR